MPKFSYATQKATPCNVNAQKWYFLNSIQKAKTGATASIRLYNRGIANYYLNGHVNVIYK
jgi:hypothetical protein